MPCGTGGLAALLPQRLGAPTFTWRTALALLHACMQYVMEGLQAVYALQQNMLLLRPCMHGSSDCSVLCSLGHVEDQLQCRPQRLHAMLLGMPAHGLSCCWFMRQC